MPSTPATAAAGMVARPAAAVRSAATICGRLAYRSESAPAGSATTAFGSWPRNASAAIWVVEAWSSSTARVGRATVLTADPDRLAHSLATKRRRSGEVTVAALAG